MLQYSLCLVSEGFEEGMGFVQKSLLYETSNLQNIWVTDVLVTKTIF